MKCYFCGEQAPRGLNAAHWLGDHWERVDVCDEQECRDRIARRPRAPRRLLPSGDMVEVEIDLAKLIEWVAQTALRSSNGRARHYHGMIRAWVRK